MALDAKQIETFKKKINKSLSVFKKYNDKHMYDAGSEEEFNSIIREFKRDLALTEQDGRLLKIGVIGTVKAGKSSLLNALLFDGEEKLPKAATPMTAALTRISYAEKTSAVIHFYDSEDWSIIEENARNYDLGLNIAYEEYCNPKEKPGKDRFNREKREKKPLKKMTKEEYEKKRYKNEVLEVFQSSKELIHMSENIEDIYSVLGTTRTVSEKEISEYVGGSGKYVSIVSYVELKISDKRMEGFEIVDTPGLDDPITSRVTTTKRFLSECDVAILLSPTSQFMDARTMELMSDRFPSAGIREVVIVGSKYDSGMLDHSAETAPFDQVRRRTTSICQSHLRENIEQLKSNRLRTGVVIDKVEPEKTIFVSSVFYSAGKKLKNKQSLTSEEKLVVDNCKRRFSGFDENNLIALSGITQMKKRLNEVVDEKERIINEKNSSLIDTKSQNLLRVLGTIRDDTYIQKKRLETEDVEQLREKTKGLTDVINVSRSKLKSVFEIAAVEVEKNSVSTKAVLEREIQAHVKIKVDTDIKEGSYTTGHFWWKKDHYYTTTTYSASVSDVYVNVHDYVGRCIQLIDNDYNNMFDKATLENNVKDIVLSSMEKGGGDFSEDDILLPLEKTMKSIEIPVVEVDVNRYLDDIKTSFSTGSVKNKEIGKLEMHQAETMTKIYEDLKKNIDKNTAEISKKLNQQAVTFSDEIVAKISEEQERLLTQVNEKEYYVELNRNFIDDLTELIKDFEE